MIPFIEINGLPSLLAVIYHPFSIYQQIKGHKMKRLGLGILCVLSGIAAAAAAEEGKIAPNEENIAAVQRGEIREALASWWGFDPEDATHSLQAAFDSGAAKLTIDKMASPWISKPLHLRSHMEIFFDDGVEIQAKRGEFLRGSDSLFNLIRVENIAIHGNGGALRMWKADYHKPPYQLAEWRHAICLGTAKNILIEDISLIESGGDGVYVGATTSGGCQDITLRNVISDGNNRQGISVISVDGLFVENCVFKNTGGAMPMAGIDFEPNSPKECLKRIVFKNCLFDHNKTDGISFYLVQLDGESEPLDVLFENCVTRGNGTNAFAFVTPPSGERNLKGTVTVKDCRFENDGGGIMVQSKGVGGNSLLFQNVKVVNAATPTDGNAALRSPIQIYSGVRDTDPAGGIVFDNVEVIDPIPRSDFNYQDSSRMGLGIADVTGSVAVRRTEDGPVVETIQLDNQRLTELYPELNPRKIMPVETVMSDFVPYNALHENAFPYDENAPGIRARNQGDFRIYAEKGETVKFTLEEFPFGDCARDRVVPKWTAPDGETRDLESFEFLGKHSYEIPVTATGVYKLWVEINPHNIVFSDCSAPFAYWAEPYAMTIQCPGTFYFYVPEGTKDFGVKLDSGPIEPFAVAICDPSGKTVWENPFLDTTFIFTPEEGFAPGIWTLKIADTDKKTLDDFCFNLLGVPSFIATQKGAVFVKKP